MAKIPSPWQKLVRGAIKDILKKVNNSQPDKKKPKKNQIKVNPKKVRNRYISTSIRVDVFKRDNFRCVFCGATSKQTQLQVDHIIPVSKGGSNDLNNLQTLCWECNRGKSDRIF